MYLIVWAACSRVPKSRFTNSGIFGTVCSGWSQTVPEGVSISDFCRWRCSTGATSSLKKEPRQFIKISRNWNLFRITNVFNLFIHGHWVMWAWTWCLVQLSFTFWPVQFFFYSNVSSLHYLNQIKHPHLLCFKV